MGLILIGIVAIIIFAIENHTLNKKIADNKTKIKEFCQKNEKSCNN